MPVDPKLQKLLDAPLRAPSTLRMPGRGKRGKEPKPYGYADIPGTGPAGKTCRDCRFDRHISSGSSRSWHKCNLMQGYWTGSRRTDILARSPACRKFEDKTDAG